MYMSLLGLEPVTSPKPTSTLYRLSSMPQELVPEGDERTRGLVELMVERCLDLKPWTLLISKLMCLLHPIMGSKGNVFYYLYHDIHDWT